VRWSVTTLTRTVPPLCVSSNSGGSTGPFSVAKAGLAPTGVSAPTGIAVNTMAAAVAVARTHAGIFTYYSIEKGCSSSKGRGPGKEECSIQSGIKTLTFPVTW